MLHYRAYLNFKADIAQFLRKTGVFRKRTDVMQGKIPERICTHLLSLVNGIFPVNNKRFFNLLSKNVNVIVKIADNPRTKNISNIFKTAVFFALAVKFSAEAFFIFKPVSYRHYAHGRFSGYILKTFLHNLSKLFVSAFFRTVLFQNQVVFYIHNFLPDDTAAFFSNFIQ